MKALREYFRPELINRIDEIIVFDRLSHENMLAIAERMLNEVASRIDSLGVKASFDPSVAGMIAACGDVKEYGARPLRREIFAKIEDPFSIWMLDGKIEAGDSVRVFAENGEIRFEKV